MYRIPAPNSAVTKYRPISQCFDSSQIDAMCRIMSSWSVRSWRPLLSLGRHIFTYVYILQILLSKIMKKSVVWLVFDLKVGINSKAVCKMCATLLYITLLQEMWLVQLSCVFVVINRMTTNWLWPNNRADIWYTSYDIRCIPTLHVTSYCT